MSQSEFERQPISTYRLQLHAGFGFREATAIVPYLARLGVTECYSSPHFRANPGSSHGYDICDHSALNPELGTEADFDTFCKTLQAHGLGHIVDIVPNHMAADSRSNPWWRDVLENGPSSPFAEYFDIDWEPIKPELKGKVLLPVLGDQYGSTLERGELHLHLQDGALHLRYFERDLPINPRQAPRVLGLNLEVLERGSQDAAVREYQSILTALHNLPAYTERDAGRIVERQREKEVARERLARLIDGSPSIRRHVEAAVTEANGTPGVRDSFDRLHELLEHQAYRLAYWRTAFDEINYRRFFDVNELVAIRMDTPAVFGATHHLVSRLISEGKITGLRVDHPDGLGDPALYFDRLQEMAGGRLYVVAEKILSAGEVLQRDWRVAGTTGYGFLNAVAGLFVHPRHVRQLRRVYARMTGRTAKFEEVAYQSRIAIMLTSMASELNVLAHALNRISETDRRSRDFTLNSCRRVLREVTACFPVYRTYISGRSVSDFDRRVLDTAIAEARRRNPVMEASIFEFLRETLVSSSTRDRAHADLRADECLRFAMQMQQFTAPVQAKGIEDTAFYRYHVLISANDVGGHPGRLAIGPEEFHEANRRRLADWPLELLATTTHDTKRGEDARARISVLSEIPHEWRRAVAVWMRINGRNRTRIDGEWAPDRNDEYLFYQILIGAWPCEPHSAEIPERAAPELVDRLRTYMGKAIREAKVHTSWIHENAEYTRAVSRFVTDSLEATNATRFLASFLPFQRKVAHAGMMNALAQLVLKVASPGVPDFFQGVELWDLSLVDPDNRRPVDFAARKSVLDSLLPTLERLESGQVVAGEVSELVDRWPDGRIKLFVTAAALRFRRVHQGLLLGGEYQPLVAQGASADHLVGFARYDDTGTLVVIVPRLSMSLTLEDGSLPRGSDAWGATRIPLPDFAAGARFRHVLTGEIVEVVDGGLTPMDAFRTLPGALLWQETGRTVTSRESSA